MPVTRVVQQNNRVQFRSSFHKWRKMLRALLVRIVLCAHSWLAVYLASYVNEFYATVIGVSFLLFVVETGLILHFNAGLELKRICTPFLVYFLTIVPTIWILRLNPNFLTSHENSTNISRSTNSSSRPFALLSEVQVLGDWTTKEETLTDLVEQSMMFVIIICRWILPRGRIDRDSLSQLLIMYSAISADILDFSEFITEDIVSRNKQFNYAVLGIWSWSLLQFLFVVTTNFTYKRQVRKSTINPESGVSATDRVDKAEVLSILMVFLMQDGPFLLVRCYAILELKMYQYLTIFFSLKNLLTLVLGIYRLIVICGCVEKEGNDLLSSEEIARSQQALDTIPGSSTNGKRKEKKKR